MRYISRIMRTTASYNIGRVGCALDCEAYDGSSMPSLFENVLHIFETHKTINKMCETSVMLFSRLVASVDIG